MGSVEQDCHLSSRLQLLPARPPTPPREANSHDLELLPKQLIAPRQFVGHLPSLQTPPGVLSPTTSSGASTARRKRVGFSSHAQYQDPPVYADPPSRLPSRVQRQTPVSLPSSSSRPVKGILKQTAIPNRLGPANGVYLDTDKPSRVNIADMLASTLQQLAGADRDSKIDAYTMLFRGLKASSNLPDRIALQEKIGLFMQFIQRDLSYSPPTGAVDILLVTSALKLLHTFLHFPGIASSIPQEFGIFLVDHCVRSFEHEGALKEVVRHLMQALCLQNFPSEVMTFDRVGRLVNALHDIENHVSGKSIIQSRIHVFEKLVKQCPQQMAVHSDWLQDLFTDMLSSTREIRAAATRLGLDAAFTLNKDRRLVGRALNLLNLSLEDKKYVEHIAERLRAMLLNKEESIFVPRVWSVITLFIPDPDKWGDFKSWSKIIQRSFNHSNIQTKKEANLAWSRLTYRLFLDRRLDLRSAMCLVRDPLLAQLKRKVVRDSVLGAIRNFYYYAFRPDMNLRVLDDAWDLGVTPLLERLIGNGQEDKANITQAAAILTGLVDCRTRRVWRQDRITDTTLIKDDELPAIESKWIRANSHRVFDLASPVLEKGFAEISVAGSSFQNFWIALVQAVAAASTKDVKLHDDTAKFVAKALTFLLGVWSKGPDSGVSGKPCTASEFLHSAREFVLILIQGLGLLPNPFTDKHFVLTKENQFNVQAAASKRPGKNHGLRRLPLHHIFYFLSNLPAGIPDDDSTVRFFESTFAPFFKDKSEKAQADLAHELLRLLPVDAFIPYGAWVMCAAKISVPLEHSRHNFLGSSSASGSNLGPEYRDVVKILERGLKSNSNLPSEHWARLFQALRSRVRDETGDAGVAIAVVEPLAGAIKDMVSNEKMDVIHLNLLDAAVEILRVSCQPRDKQAVDAARRRLWGISSSAIRQSSFDPFDNLYKVIDSVLGKLYASVGSYEPARVAQLLDEIRYFFDRSNVQLQLRALVAMQVGLVHWFKDNDHRITGTDLPVVAEAVRSLWQKLCSVLIDTSADKLNLDVVEPLLCAAFQSTHREVVAITAEAWNRIYEDADQIGYSETLKKVLTSLGSSIDVTRPGLEIADTGSNNHRHDFSESQDDFNHLPTISPAKFQPTPQPWSSASRRSATPGSINAVELTRTKSKGRTPKQRLRHEDSQIQFAAIESSPAMVAQESQLLTDRQREIRERQRETAAMFPEMRSSPTEKTKKARSAIAQPLAKSTAPLRASTPEREHDFEDCLISTPTPRRGQPVPLLVQDQEMTDPPSSPPEPRGYRLLAELKSQAKNVTSMDDWQFSSSPVSGSPNPALATVSASSPMELEDVDEELRLDDEGVAVQKDEEAQPGPTKVTSSQLETDGDLVEDTTIFGQMEEAAEGAHSGLKDVACSHLETDSDLLEDTTMFGQMEEAAVAAAAAAAAAASAPAPARPSATHESQTTPSGRQLRSSRLHLTPRSDNDEFVDALSSPGPPTPNQRVTKRSSVAAGVQRRSPRQTGNSQSFDVSTSFENDMRNVGTGRIEILLRSSQVGSPRKEYLSFQDILPESPEQAPEPQRSEQPQKEQRVATGALDSIEVAGAESKKPRRGRSRSRHASGSQNSRVSQPSQPSLDIQIPQHSQAPILSTPVNELSASGSQDSFENVSPGNGQWLRKRKRSVSSVYSSGGSKKSRHEDLFAAEATQEEVPDSQPAAVADQERPVVVQTAELYENDVSMVTTLSSSPAVQQASQELGSTVDQCAGDVLEEAAEEPQPEPVNEVQMPDERMEDGGDDTDDEEAVHSQLVREEQEASAGEESRRASRAASPAQQEPEPVALTFRASEVDEEEMARENSAKESRRAESEPSKFGGLMTMFRSGLDTLRSVDLTRDQFYEAEDIFFEMRRELLEAERRGRR